MQWIVINSTNIIATLGNNPIPPFVVPSLRLTADTTNSPQNRPDNAGQRKRSREKEEDGEELSGREEAAVMDEGVETYDEQLRVHALARSRANVLKCIALLQLTSDSNSSDCARTSVVARRPHTSINSDGIIVTC